MGGWWGFGWQSRGCDNQPVVLTVAKTSKVYTRQTHKVGLSESSMHLLNSAGCRLVEMAKTLDHRVLLVGHMFQLRVV